MNIHPKVGKMEDALEQYKKLVHFVEHQGFGRPIQCWESAGTKECAMELITSYKITDAKGNAIYARISYGIQKTEQGLFPAVTLDLSTEWWSFCLRYVTDRHEWTRLVRTESMDGGQLIDPSKIGGVISDAVAAYRRQIQQRDTVIVPGRIIDIKG